MQTKGPFSLMTVAEFAVWLSSLSLGRKIVRVQNHHTWSPSYKDFDSSNHFALLTSMDTSHRERGFDMIAQNMTIFPDGMVAICRPFERIPAGIKGANTDGLCIENVGNFDVGGDTMDARQRTAIVQVSALLARKFSLPFNTDAFVYHHWWDLNTGARTNGTGSTKSCPGTAFFGGNTVAAAQANFLPLIAAAANGTTTPPAVPLRTGVVTADSLNVRDQPSTAGKILSRLSRAAAVSCYEDSGDWTRIHPTKAMWVSRRYVSV